MGTAPDLPTDNDGWFKRHIIEQLKDLKEGHSEMMRNQREMHTANISRMDGIVETMRDHEESDVNKFASLNQSISDFQPVKKVVYGFIILVLTAFVSGLIGMVIVKH